MGLQTGNDAALFPLKNKRPYVLLKITILTLFVSTLTSCALFPQNPKPCDCAKVEADLYRYTAEYVTCLEDLGNARAAKK